MRSTDTDWHKLNCAKLLSYNLSCHSLIVLQNINHFMMLSLPDQELIRKNINPLRPNDTYMPQWITNVYHHWPDNGLLPVQHQAII